MLSVWMSAVVVLFLRAKMTARQFTILWSVSGTGYNSKQPGENSPTLLLTVPQFKKLDYLDLGFSRYNALSLVDFETFFE